MTTATIAAAACAACFTAAADASIIADSVNDFLAATNDGIDQFGGAVTPGSALDAAQQFHTDATGSGTWSYGFGNSGDGGAFGGGFPLLDVWNNGWGATGVGTVLTAFSQAPLGSSLVANPMAYRRWNSSGASDGDTLTAVLTVTLTNTLSDGVTIIFGANNTNAQTILIEPSDVGVEMTYSVDFTDSATANVLAGIRPEGIGPNNISNFFNDSVSIELLIIPAPASAALALAALAPVARRRRAAP